MTSSNGFETRNNRKLFRLFPNTKTLRKNSLKKMTNQPDKFDNKPDMKTYFLGNEGEFKKDVSNIRFDLPRFIGFNLLAVVLAFGSNFLGTLSLLFTFFSLVLLQILSLKP